MTTIKNTLALLAAIGTPTPSPTPQTYECGSVDVFYTGFPPYHPMIDAMGWDQDPVAVGIRNDTLNLVKAGYNVHAVWAGTEIPVSEVGVRMDQSGVDFDVLAIGYGVRGATIEPIVERFEDLIDLYKHKYPETPIVFNYSPWSFVWSVAHRKPMREDCEAVGKPGKLLGYEEICDERCNPKAWAKKDKKDESHDEL